MTTPVETLRQQLLQLKSLHDGGGLSTEHYHASREKLERTLLDLVVNGPVEDATPRAIAASVANDTPSVAPQTWATDGQMAPRPRSRWLMPAASAAALLVAIAGYAWKGAPTLVNASAASAARTATADAATAGGQSNNHSMDAAKFEALVEKLKQRMDTEPNNAEGWAMLARSYANLGKTDEAVSAFAKAVALMPNDASLLADYADSLAVKQGRNLEGEPTRLIARALAIDSDDPKALSLSGTVAFDRKDYAGAVKQWERILSKTPEHPFAPQLHESISEARRLGGLAPTPSAPTAAAKGAATAAIAAAATPPVAAVAPAATAHVSGTVSLAPNLAAQTKPDDTVFVFARSVDGPRMPLAIMRKQVKDLPFDFKLDDSTAMTPQARLSLVEQVVVGVRVSKSGNATPQPGDLQGLPTTVKVGASGVNMVLDQVVGP